LSALLPQHESELISRVAKGDEKAFGRLFHAYRDKLYAFAYRIAGSREIAEDIVQDVFLKIWMLREKVEDIDNFNAFLYRMSQNHAINQLRRMARETVALKHACPRQEGAWGVGTDPATFSDIRNSLSEIVERLPPRQKEVYRLSREQNLKQEEIARRLHISVSTVKNHMTQALHTIQQGLSQYYPLIMIAMVFLGRFHSF
jgi:RNA polymerase sigma-70 factor (ECF subfamily)